MLRGKRVTLRKTEPADLDTLACWFADPAFVQWWGGTAFNREAVRNELLSSTIEKLADGRTEYVERYIVEYDEVSIGYAQSWCYDNREGGLDVVTAPKFQDQGLEPMQLGRSRFTLRDALHWERVTVDPLVTNARAIHVFSKAGFLVEREWPDHPDGPSLLMLFKNEEGPGR